MERPKAGFLRQMAARYALGGVKGIHGKQNSATGGWEAILGTIMQSNSGEIWKTWTDAQLEALYSKHAVVFACTRKIFSAAQEAVLEIGYDKKTGFKPIYNHLMYDKLIKTPNPTMTSNEYIAFVIASFLLTGESYTWEWKNNAGYIDQLWPVPKSWVFKRQHADGTFAFYEVYQGNRPRIPVIAEDMAKVFLTDPRNPANGVGPLQAAIRDVDTDQARENYIAEMLINLKVPGLVLTQPEGWTIAQKEDARALLTDLVGTGKRGRPLFLEGEKAKAEMMAPLKDLDWPGLSKLSESRICAAFGVPPITVGVRAGLEHSTYSNYQEANKAFYRQTMVPLWKSLAAAFTRAYLTNEGEPEDLIFQFDTSDVVELQEDRGVASDRAVKLFLGGLITRNHGRELVGEEPLDKIVGDVLVMPLNYMEIPADGSGTTIIDVPDKGKPTPNEEEDEEEEIEESIEEDDEDEEE